MEKSYINRFRSYCRSLAVLQQSKGADPEAMFVLGATAQAFNLTFDLSWKVMKGILTEELGFTEFAAGSPRDTLKSAFQGGLIEDDQWMEMLRIRNTLAHDYDGAVARKYFTVIVNEFCELFESFQNTVENRTSE